MDANVDERESEEASIEIEDLYKLAKRYVLPMISLRLTVYYPVEVLFHASTNMGKILDDRVLLAKNGHATGHSKSPISKLRGVFFFAKGADDTKWTISRFGNQLLRVIPRSLLNTEWNNFYFGNFRCYSRRQEPHYLTIVVSRRGSKKDRYCAANLFALDMENNPFFFVSQDENGEQQFHVICGCKVYVELFFTYVIELDEIEYSQTDVDYEPKNSSRQNEHCDICNVYKI